MVIIALLSYLERIFNIDLDTKIKNIPNDIHIKLYKNG